MENPFIQFHYEETDFSLESTEPIKEWISNCIQTEQKKKGSLNFIFCNDKYLHAINLEYLNHDTYTDIITFNYVENDVISGDIFISIERVKENSQKLSTPFEKELKRVLIHGILHLIGYNDKTPEETQEIRAKEDFYLNLCAE